MRKLLSAALAAALTLGALSDSVTAQEMGTIDAGFFGRYSLIDESLSPDDALSLGLHFGMFVFRNWALETQGSYGATSGDPSAKLAPFYVRLAYHRAFTDKWTGIIGAGWVQDNTDRRVTATASRMTASPARWARSGISTIALPCASTSSATTSPRRSSKVRAMTSPTSISTFRWG